jgi:hypothetical protein
MAQVITDPSASVLRPAPLSEKASAQLVRTVLGGKAQDAFCLACHTATGGNPLLLREFADAAAAEGLEATAAGVLRLHEIGPQAVKRRVALRLARLGPPAVAFCGALAVLGDDASSAHVAMLAGLASAEALQVARQLADIDGWKVTHGRPACSPTAVPRLNAWPLTCCSSPLPTTVFWWVPCVAPQQFPRIRNAIRCPGHQPR